MKRLVSTLLTLLLAASAAAQDSTPTGATAAEGTEAAQPRRDPQALELLELSVAALGGRVAIAQVRACVALGRMQAADGSGLGSGSFVWKDAGREFRYENPRAEGPQVVTSGHGRAALTRNGETKRLRGQTTMNHVAPHLAGLALYNRLADTRYSLRVLGSGTVEGAPAAIVRTSLTSAQPLTSELTQQDWFLDAKTGLPLRVEIQIPGGEQGSEWRIVAMELSDFRVVSGIVIPFQIVTFVEDQPQSLMVLDSVSLNSGLSPTEFEAPTGGGQ